MSLFTTCLVVAAVALLTAWPVALWREKRTFSRPAAAFLRLHPAGRGFYQFGLDMDIDGDGLADSFESLVTLTDPLASDSDLDGLPDGVEWSLGTDPTERDTDGTNVLEWSG